MADRLFVFLGAGIAQQPTGRGPGARHALLMLARGAAIADARAVAVALAENNGWMDVVVLREKEMDADLDQIGDETLGGAAKTALVEGSALVVYADEMPLDG